MEHTYAQHQRYADEREALRKRCADEPTAQLVVPKDGQPPFWQELNTLEFQVAKNEQLLSLLAGKLEPFMAPHPPIAGLENDPGGSSECPVINQLAKLTRRVQACGEWIEGLTERLVI